MTHIRHPAPQKNHILFIGVLLLLVGLLGNTWAINTITSVQPGFDNLADVVFLVLVNLPLALIGLYLIMFRREINEPRLYKGLTNSALALFSIIVCLAGVELVLRAGLWDDRENPFPVWIPYKYQKLNDAINRANIARSRHNSHGFNDRPRALEKKAGTYRIAVLGDSFVWGDGVSYGVAWSHRLEEKFQQAYSGKVEVLSWGRRGWSTLDQFQFLQESGIRYHPDVLIVAFTSNDPDLGFSRQQYFKLKLVPLVGPVRAVLPNAVDFFSDYLEAMVNRWSRNIGYKNWENQLYTPENLEKYSHLLEKFAAFCRRQHLPLLFVLTPCYHDPGHQARFAAVTPLLRQAGIAYLDLWPAVARDLHDVSPRDLWANPANPHPGGLLTEVYASEVFNYLKGSYLLGNGPWAMGKSQ